MKRSRLNGAAVPIPRVSEGRAESPLVLGVRPEHIRLADSSNLRARIFGAEYLGTTQIVTLDTEHGQVKARIPADAVARAGETVGLTFRTPQLSLFDAATGRAIRKPRRRGPCLRSGCRASASVSARPKP